MADMLRNGGGGLKRNVAEAVKLHKVLAEKGQITSINNLGSIYMNGRGNVKPDFKLAAKYIHMYLKHTEQRQRRGSKNGHNHGEPAYVYGQNLINLGVLYRDGKGVEQDLEKAILYFEKAVKAKHRGAHKALGDIYTYYAEHGVQDSEKMLYHYTEGAKAGNTKCLNSLGLAYERGELLPKNNAEALKYYKLAAAKKHQYALWNLGRIYENGKPDVEKNIKEAIRFYTLGAKAGNIKSQSRLGFIYLKGEIVPKDIALSVKFYTQAANKNHATSLFNLGVIYGSEDFQELGIKKDANKAMGYFKRSLKAGYKPAEEAIKELNAE
jgi:TPR repeat protein